MSLSAGRIKAVATTGTYRQRTFALSLLTLLTLTGIAFGPTIDASASTRPAAETRVRAIDTPTPALVAATSPPSLTAVGSSGLQIRQFVSATGVATNSAVPGASYTKIYDGGGGVIVEVDDAGVLNLAIETGPSSPRGGQMFDEALSAVGSPNGIRGTWNTSMPSNLDAFNASLRAGMSVEDAARATFTGTMAGRSGFTAVTVEQLTGSPGTYTNVKVVFGR